MLAVTVTISLALFILFSLNGCAAGQKATDRLAGWNIDSEFTSESEGEETTMMSAAKDSYYLTL